MRIIIIPNGNSETMLRDCSELIELSAKTNAMGSNINDAHHNAPLHQLLF